MTVLHAGGKFGGGGYKVSGGLHGVGASVVNALAARLDVEVDRAGKTYGMSFRRGEPGTFSDRGGRGPDGTFTAYESKSALPVVGRAKRGVTGSRVRFWPDHEIFEPGAELDLEQLTARARLAERLAVARDEAASVTRRAQGHPPYPSPWDTGPHPVPPRPRRG